MSNNRWNIAAITYSFDPSTKKLEKMAKTLDAAARRHQFPNEAYKSTLESEWFAFYQVQAKAIRLVDIESADESGTVDRIWSWFHKELCSQSFRKLTKVVTPLLGNTGQKNS